MPRPGDLLAFGAERYLVLEDRGPECLVLTHEGTTVMPSEYLDEMLQGGEATNNATDLPALTFPEDAT